MAKIQIHYFVKYFSKRKHKFNNTSKFSYFAKKPFYFREIKEKIAQIPLPVFFFFPLFLPLFKCEKSICPCILMGLLCSPSPPSQCVFSPFSQCFQNCQWKILLNMLQGYSNYQKNALFKSYLKNMFGPNF